MRSGYSVRNRTPSGCEILNWLPLIRQEIALLLPKVIATLGNIPLQAVYKLAGEKVNAIGICHGHVQKLYIDKKEYSLFPLYHPASGIYNRTLIEVMREDARLLGKYLHELR